MTEVQPNTDIASSITADSTSETLRQAAAALVAGNAVLLTEPDLALQVRDSVLCCEVSDPQPLAHRCEIEYEVLVENARRALEASAFAAHLPALSRRWFVVERHGDSGDKVLWTAP